MVRRKFFAANLISSTRKSVKAGLNRRGLSNRALICWNHFIRTRRDASATDSALLHSKGSDKFSTNSDIR